MHQFHNEMTILKNHVVSMGNHALKMLEEGFTALSQRDIILAEKVHNERIELREYDDKIEEEALRLIALYQPMAIDIRTLTICLKLNTSLYRIGRYGKDIAQITPKLIELSHPFQFVKIDQMALLIFKMIQQAMNAFLTNNIESIIQIGKQDDTIDDLNQEAVNESIKYMIDDPSLITMGAYNIMIARYLERCGDHAVKIAEKVYFMVTGKNIELK